MTVPQPRPGKRPSLAKYLPLARNLIIENNATSNVSANDDDTVWIARRLGTNEITFYGNVKHSYRTEVPVTIHDPPQFFADLFSERLEARGVDVGTARTVRHGESESSGKVIGPVITTPIATD